MYGHTNSVPVLESYPFLRNSEYPFPNTGSSTIFHEPAPSHPLSPSTSLDAFIAALAQAVSPSLAGFCFDSPAPISMEFLEDSVQLAMRMSPAQLLAESGSREPTSRTSFLPVGDRYPLYGQPLSPSLAEQTLPPNILRNGMVDDQIACKFQIGTRFSISDNNYTRCKLDVYGTGFPQHCLQLCGMSCTCSRVELGRLQHGYQPPLLCPGPIYAPSCQAPSKTARPSPSPRLQRIPSSQCPTLRGSSP
jgi:hypothetical protein